MDVRSGLAGQDFERPSPTVADSWVTVRRAPLYRRSLKRWLDVAFVVLALPIVVPVILVLAAILKLGGSAAFYSQERVGLGGRTFRLWKLRTMVDDADARLEAHLRTNEAARRHVAASRRSAAASASRFCHHRASSPITSIHSTASCAA